jgi:hypothetical protein
MPSLSFNLSKLPKPHKCEQNIASSFFIEIIIGNVRLKHVVVHPSSFLKFMPLYICWALGMTHLSPTNLVVGFKKYEEKLIGSLTLDLTKPKIVSFFRVVLNQDLEYNILLRCPSL